MARDLALIGAGAAAGITGVLVALVLWLRRIEVLGA